MTRFALFLTLGLLFSVTCTFDKQAQGSPSAETAETALPCALFPGNNIWNTPIDMLPVDANSAAYINAIGSTTGLHPDFGTVWEGAPIGVPYNIVPGTQPKVAVSFDYEDESDPGPYPIPANPLIEGGPDADGDRHILVLDKDNCILYEVYDAWPNPDGSWDAGSGAIYNLASHALRPDGWTSADAAGLPILPGLVRYDEVLSGEITHAIRFTAPDTRRAYVWPARHFASYLTGAQYPPMGQRFRLKASFDVSGFDPKVQVILRAMQKYGIILADNGSPWFITGVPDSRWNDDILVNQLRQVKGSNFEAVDVSSLMIDKDSGQARQPDDPPDHIIYLSAIAAGAAGGVSFTGADILTYSKASNRWGMWFDGSSAGTPANVSAFTFQGDGVLLSFSTAQTVSGPGTVVPQDIVRFTPATTGLNNTRGTYSWHFDGSDVGLTTSAETIDALWADAQGRLYLSTTGSGVVPADSALPDGAKVRFQDEDVLRFTFRGTPGAVTAGTWQLYYNATLLPGMATTDVSGYWQDSATGDRFITLGGVFSIGDPAYGQVSGNRKSIVKLVANPDAPGGYAPSLQTWLAPGATFPVALDAIELDR